MGAMSGTASAEIDAPVEAVWAIAQDIEAARVRFAYASPSELRWTQEHGDLRSMDGSWRLKDAGGGRTLATYTLDGDPGVLMGRFLKGALEEKVRRILSEGRPGELKARVEAG